MVTSIALTKSWSELASEHVVASALQSDSDMPVATEDGPHIRRGERFGKAQPAVKLIANEWLSSFSSMSLCLVQEAWRWS